MSTEDVSTENPPQRSKLSDHTDHMELATTMTMSNSPIPDDDHTIRVNNLQGQHQKTESANQDGTVGIGSILKDRFFIDKEIGRGGMGVVYRARDNLKEKFQDRNPYLAIKVLSEECKSNPDFLIALQREAGKAQKLAHPNIVTVYDFDSDGTNVFMTMEYLEGESLQRLLKRRGQNSLPTKTALALIEEMGKGLAYAHQKGIVHCDFKPANVFLTNDDHVKILDFGIARPEKRPEHLQQDVTRFDAGKLGALTPTYASCELIEGDSPDQRDDIYSLACVAYESLTGRHPFNRLPADVARDSKLKPAPIKELDKKQWNALVRGLSFERASRPANVFEFLEELKGQQKVSAALYGRQLIFGISMIALVSIIAVYVTQDMFKHAQPETETITTTHTDTPPVPVELSTEQQKIVDRLLEAAEIHFLVKRITEPVGSNAYEAYKHALEIDPANEKAKAGLKQIADYYENLARESIQDGNPEKARSVMNIGLSVLPQHKGLNKLRSEIEGQSITTRLASWIRNLWQ